MRARALVLAIAVAVVSGCAAIAGVRDDLELAGADDAAASDGSPTTDGSASETSTTGDGGTVCRESETVCSGACVTLETDPNNCGRCGEVCPGGAVCNAGSCSTTGCGIGLVDCSGACVNVTTDPNHCGGCGKACSAAQDCVAGACTTLTTGRDSGRPDTGVP